MTTNDTLPQSELEGAKAALVELLVDAIGEKLRDVWVLDQRTQEPLYLREDVAERVDDINVEKFLDNERYGFVTRQTYNLLHYSEFRYTHRGFDTWELYRTFVVQGDTQVGVIIGLDSDGTNYDFSAYTDEIHELAEDHGVDALVPVSDD